MPAESPLIPARTTRRQAIAAAVAGVLATTVNLGAQEPAKAPAAKKKGHPSIEVPPDAVTGPMVGHTSDRETHLWIRPAKPGPVTLVVRAASGGGEKRFAAVASQDNDLCVTIRVPDLQPATEYVYRFEQNGGKIGAGQFRTWTPGASPAKVTLALGSCADNVASSVWTQMQKSGANAILLMGDTPYIDSYDLATVRRRHREFLHVPELKPLISQLPVWGTWDDHDFGLNSHLGNSNPAGKQRTRQGFTEYRPNANHGENGAGVYTSFRAGPIEVWLLDPRWFSFTEKSPVAPSEPSCFGAAQWKWLLSSLKASTATFKLLAMGEVWQDKENKEKDDLGTFPYEREALYDFIRAEKIGGVFLFGGDIHCSRHLCTKGRVGYDLHDLVSSPIHGRIIPALNVPHPDLIWGEPVPHTFLRIVADTTVQPARLTATFLNEAGKNLHEVELTRAQLTPA